MNIQPVPWLFAGSPELQVALQSLTFTCLDIGARRGFANDVKHLAPRVDAIGFEPDPAECERLNSKAKSDAHNWKSLRFIPAALGDEAGSKKLNVYSQAGCSSLLDADIELATRFSRESYYRLEKRIDIRTERLDDIAERHACPDVDFLKIDVQGFELNVFRGGIETLKNTVVLRTEVSFMRSYVQQPLFAEIDQWIRNELGLEPVAFQELHAWRQLTKSKLPHLNASKPHYSKGQLVHGDVLYVSSPDRLARVAGRSVQKPLKLFFLMLALGFIDRALEIAKDHRLAAVLTQSPSQDVVEAIADVDRRWERIHLRSQRRELWADLRRVAKAHWRSLKPRQ